MEHREFLSFIENDCIAASVAACAHTGNDDERVNLIWGLRQSWAQLAWISAQREHHLSVDDWVEVLGRVQARTPGPEFQAALRSDIATRLRAAGLPADEILRRLNG